MIVTIDAAARPEPREVGGKGAGLAFLAAAGVPVPPAFVVTADGFRAAVPAALRAEAASLAADLPPAELEARCAALRERIVAATEGHPLTASIATACGDLLRRTGADELCVAVRSSSIAEDAADQSFAGEHDTYLWVLGAEEVDRRVRDCWASLVTSRAVAYRRSADAGDVAMAVVVQEMAPARAAGVFMTLNPANGDRSKVAIESVLGLGEPLVSGAVDPDRFLVDKITGEIRRRDTADKTTRAVRDPATGRGVVIEPVPPEAASEPSLSDAEIAELVRIARLVEGEAGSPQDGEFVVVPSGEVMLVQCRPETAWSRRPREPVAQGRTAMQSVLAALTHKTS